MKKSFLVLAMLLTFGSSMFAQDIDLGIKIGYQTPQLSYQKADIKAGFQNHLTLGFFGRVELGSFYVQPEILYFKTDNIFELNATNVSSGLLPEENVTFTLNAANLQVPILFGIKPSIVDFGLVALRAHFGPTANFTLASKTLFDKTYSLTGSNGETVAIDEDEEAFDTKSIAWGMQIGVGADILGKITLDINYNFGISKMFNALNNTNLNNYFDFSNVDNTKQNLFMVTVGYKFL